MDVVRPRLGRGGTLALRFTLRPSDHLAFELNGSRRWLDVAPDGGESRRSRLFTAEVGRLKATLGFNSRTYLRLIGQRVRTERDPRLFLPVQVPRLEDAFSGSALFAYKLNWQTVFFVGYGDDRAVPTAPESGGHLEPAARKLFLKVSYAFQR